MSPTEPVDSARRIDLKSDAGEIELAAILGELEELLSLALGLQRSSSSTHGADNLSVQLEIEAMAQQKIGRFLMRSRKPADLIADDQ